jgi:hypothetical protein
VRNARRAWLAAVGLLVLGCLVLAFWVRRGSEPWVTGTVKLDGRPLPRGSIALIPIEGTPGPGGGGGISKEGKYEINKGLRPGKYQVEIRSTITTRRMVLNFAVPNEHVPEEVPIIPEEYNTGGGLIREAKPGPNVWDFDLKGVAAGR